MRTAKTFLKTCETCQREFEAGAATVRACSFECAFWIYVDKTPGFGPQGDCWKWTGVIHTGYGQLRYKSGRCFRAHVASLIVAKRHVPQGMCVCHKCDEPLCVNPDHLFVGTQNDNVQDKIRKGRDARGAKHRASMKRLPHGELVRHAKLTQAQVDAILAMPPKTKWKALAAELGVCYRTIWRVRSGRSWGSGSVIGPPTPAIVQLPTVPEPVRPVAEPAVRPVSAARKTSKTTPGQRGLFDDV